MNYIAHYIKTNSETKPAKNSNLWHTSREEKHKLPCKAWSQVQFEGICRTTWWKLLTVVQHPIKQYTRCLWVKQCNKCIFSLHTEKLETVLSNVTSNSEPCMTVHPLQFHILWPLVLPTWLKTTNIMTSSLLLGFCIHKGYNSHPVIKWSSSKVL